MNDEERFEELRENEIKRLTDSLGSEEPMNGILTDDEILKYAGNSIAASEIRLKRGNNNFQDKMKIHGDTLSIMWIVGLLPIGMTVGVMAFLMDIFAAKVLFILIILFLIGYTAYYLYLKDYTEPQYKIINSNDNINSSEVIEKGKISDTEDLLLLFESKEKIAREMIERRFPAPQMTNTKFNSVLDNCKEVVESQIEILNALTPTEKTKYEISSRKKLIKQLISKVDDLTNELILSEENNVEDVIEDMDDVINSIKDYK